MNKDIKTKWVKALRSGEFKQCNERLHNGEGYCCLGVLECIVCGREKAFKIRMEDWSARMVYVTEDGSERINYKTVEEVKIPPFECDTLMSMNDSNQSFSEIADYIESNL